jgi:hypothetical protein
VLLPNLRGGDHPCNNMNQHHCGLHVAGARPVLRATDGRLNRPKHSTKGTKEAQLTVKDAYAAAQSSPTSRCLCVTSIVLVLGCQNKDPPAGGVGSYEKAALSYTNATYTEETGEPGTIRIHPNGGEGTPIRSVRVKNVDDWFEAERKKPGSAQKPRLCNGCVCQSGECECVRCK